MTVEAVKIAGPNDNEFGVFCQGEDGHGYYLSVTSDGYAGIFRIDDEATPLRDWKRSNAIARGASTNHIVGECRGGRDGAPAELKLWVNGRGVARGRDESGLAPTYFGVYAGSFEKPGVEVLFDNFALERLAYAEFLERVRARILRA
jgi:hypothetical protein